MKRPGLLALGPFSGNTLIVLVAVFAGLFANTAFFTSAFNFYKDGAEIILFASSLLPFIAAIFVVILSAL